MVTNHFFSFSSVNLDYQPLDMVNNITADLLDSIGFDISFYREITCLNLLLFIFYVFESIPK